MCFSFGKQIPGTKRRNCQCIVLEQSEMLAVSMSIFVFNGRQCIERNFLNPNSITD